MPRNSASGPTFKFEGSEIPIAPGATIAAALTAAGEVALKHSRQGDLRGLFCGMGVCQECLVTVDQRPVTRACMTAAGPGTRVSRAPALMQLLGQRDGETPIEHQRHSDVLVIGGGPGGLSAAAVAAEAGLDVVLLDERAKLGGQYFKQPASADSLPSADAQFAAGKRLIERTAAAGVEVHNSTNVWGAFGLDAICAVSAAERWRFECDALILAPGAYERGVPFPGWTLPGVMTTGAAQTLWRSYGVAPGARVLVAGNGPLNMQVAAELTTGGVTVVGLAELAPSPFPRRAGALAGMARADPSLIRDGLRYRSVLARARVPVMYGSVVARVEGDQRAQVAVVTSVDGSGRTSGRERRVEVDAVCLGLGFVPSSEIARSLGCRHQYRADHGHLVTAVDACGVSSVENVWVVGDGAGIRGARHAQAQGQIAAFDVVRRLRGSVPGEMSQHEGEAIRAAARHQRFQDALARVFDAPSLSDELTGPETHICRCEGVTRQAIETALAEGAGHLGAIKRQTRAGMGPCQGRYCAPVIAAMLARGSGEPPSEFSGFAPSPPVKPVAIGDLLAVTE
ncbi:MAG: FAD-dependent oxidoreductase, partial [Trebonia sp.]